MEMQQPNYEGRCGKAQIRLLEPAAAVSHPPRTVGNRNGREQAPPNRQNDIGHNAQHSERDPEDLALHNPLIVVPQASPAIRQGKSKQNFGVKPKVTPSPIPPYLMADG